MPLEPVWREFFEAAALLEAVDPHLLLAPEVSEYNAVKERPN